MTTIRFGAPVCRSVRTVTAFALVILALPPLVALFTPARPPLPVLVILIALPLLILAGTFAGRVRGYTLTEKEIVVQRGFGETRLPLAGLRSVGGDAEAMSGSVRVFGNGGLFAITGRYWNRKLRWYRAYATDPSRAVVLRYADRTIVITPHDPQQFIMRAGTFIRTAGFPT